MFIGIIKRLHEINAPLGANTGTPVAGEFALYEMERSLENGNRLGDPLIGIGILKFLLFASNDNQAAKEFKEVISMMLDSVKDRYEAIEVLRGLRGIWIQEALELKEVQE